MAEGAGFEVGPQCAPAPLSELRKDVHPLGEALKGRAADVLDLSVDPTARAWTTKRPELPGLFCRCARRCVVPPHTVMCQDIPDTSQDAGGGTRAPKGFRPPAPKARHKRADPATTGRLARLERVRAASAGPLLPNLLPRELVHELSQELLRQVVTSAAD